MAPAAAISCAAMDSASGPVPRNATVASRVPKISACAFL